MQPHRRARAPSDARATKLRVYLDRSSLRFVLRPASSFNFPSAALATASDAVKFTRLPCGRALTH